VAEMCASVIDVLDEGLATKVDGYPLDNSLDIQQWCCGGAIGKFSSVGSE